jgi:hypothetical protein
MAGSYYPRIATDGLALCLDVGNRESYPGSGTAWNDLSLNSKNGVLSGGTAYNTASLGSITFNGVDAISVHGALPGSFATFTVSVWFFPLTFTNFQNVIDCNYAYNGTTGNIGPRFEIDGSGGASWYYSDITNNNNRYYGHSSGQMQLNRWNNSTITYDGSNSFIYYNGSPTGTVRGVGSGGAPTGFIGSMNNVYIGRGFSLATRFFNGRVSHVTIYNRALTASEVSQNFSATRGRFGI